MTAPQTQARQQIETLIQRYRTLDEVTRKNTSEASVVHQFITPLLQALGRHAIRPSANDRATRSTRRWRTSTA